MKSLIYSSYRKKKIKKIIKITIILLSTALIFLIGQQFYYRYLIERATKIQAPQITDFKKDILSQTKNWPYQVRQVEEKQNMITLIVDHIIVILSKEKDITEQLGALQLILNQDKIKGRKTKKIDLRFNNPLITY